MDTLCLPGARAAELGAPIWVFTEMFGDQLEMPWRWTSQLVTTAAEHLQID
jgi:hypothetical protein